MFILRGKLTTKKPTVGDIGKEITHLINGHCSDVSLSSGDEYIKLIPREEHSKSFDLEVFVIKEMPDKKGKIYIKYGLKALVNNAEAIKYFSNYLDQKEFKFDSAWKKYSEEKEYTNKTKVKSNRLLAFLKKPAVYGSFSGIIIISIVALFLMSFSDYGKEQLPVWKDQVINQGSRFLSFIYSIFSYLTDWRNYVTLFVYITEYIKSMFGYISSIYEYLNAES